MATDLRLRRVEGKGVRDLSILLRNIVGFSDSIHMDRVNGLVNEQRRPILELDKQDWVSDFILPSDVVLDSIAVSEDGLVISGVSTNEKSIQQLIVNLYEEETIDEYETEFKDQAKGLLNLFFKDLANHLVKDNS